MSSNPYNPPHPDTFDSSRNRSSSSNDDGNNNHRIANDISSADYALLSGSDPVAWSSVGATSVNSAPALAPADIHYTSATASTTTHVHTVIEIPATETTASIRTDNDRPSVRKVNAEEEEILVVEAGVNPTTTVLRPNDSFTDETCATLAAKSFNCLPVYAQRYQKTKRKMHASSFFFDKYTRMAASSPTYRSKHRYSPPMILLDSPSTVRVTEKNEDVPPKVDTPTTKRFGGVASAHDPYLDFVSRFFPSVYMYEPLKPDDMKLGKVPEWMYQLYSLPNLAIPMSYFCIGVALHLIRTPLIVYFIQEQGASASDINVLFTVMAVPWCFKVFYGFLSDCFPIRGQRRKPYFFAGWLVYVIGNIIPAITPQPSIQSCIFFVFVQTAGFMLSDVMTDALVVERSQYEPMDIKGTMQSQGYVIRFFGAVIGAIVGAFLFNTDLEWFLSINTIFFLNALFPVIFLVPVVPFLMEIETNCVAQDLTSQVKILFDTVQLKAVWKPMIFVYIYNALQLTNPAWMNFLVTGLHFKAWMIGLVGIVGSVFSWIGLMAYEKYFFASSWRIVYLWCTGIVAIISIAQVILVFGWNRKFGISDLLFSVGDDVFEEFILGVQFLPMCIMYLGLCPEGTEGTTYALLTTFANLAGTIAFDISTLMTKIWDVSSDTIAAGDYDGVWKLSLICAITSPLPLVFIYLIPKGKDDQVRLQKDTKRHYWKGVIFVIVTLVSLVFTFWESWYEVYHEKPGHIRVINEEIIIYTEELYTIYNVTTYDDYSNSYDDDFYYDDNEENYRDEDENDREKEENEEENEEEKDEDKDQEDGDKDRNRRNLISNHEYFSMAFYHRQRKLSRMRFGR